MYSFKAYVLIARGFLQKYSIGDNKVFSLMVRLDIIRVVVLIASSMKWPLYYMDVKYTFLNSPLEEKII